MTTTPVFYDPSARRWARFKHAVQAVAALVSTILTIFVVRVIINPVLPSIGLVPAGNLPQRHHLAPPRPTPVLSRSERRFQHAKRRLGTALAQLGPAATVTEARTRHPGTLIAFYVNWDDTSFTSLKHNLPQVDKLVPEWLHLKSGDGTVVRDDPGKQARVLAYLRAHRPQLPVMPLINNFDDARMEWDATGLAVMLKHPAARARTIRTLLQFVREIQGAGINVDFENIPPRAQQDLQTFMQELFTQFHAQGLEVSQSVPLDDPSFDYRRFARWNDYLVLMAYDEHWSSSKTGPVASQSWYAAALHRRFAELPADKYVVALGNYGYDWQPHRKDANEISFQEALTTAQESEGQITLDPRSLNPFFDYYDEHDVLHHVWFLDGVTLFNQIAEGQHYHPRGFALWRLGSEDPSVWPILAERGQVNRATAETLKTLHYGYDLDYEGAGEVLRVTATPHDGQREVTYDGASGLITAEQLHGYPSPYVITRWGRQQNKQVALTFDDGPDAQYTPQILDILRQYQVPATFFIVGLNGDLNSKLLQRTVDEGHEIGNHTFSHPDIGAISQQQLRLEINATERLFESRLGLRSVLFRPPYAEDVEPETPDHVRPLLQTSAEGYYTIGMQIDPNDWRNPGVEEIVQATIAGAVNGDGAIVLLHDSGGDRSQTVAALPKIIEGLRERGFTLVPVSTLLGLSCTDVMPPLPQEAQLGARITDAGFLLINWTSVSMHYVFLCGIILGTLRIGFIVILALRTRWHWPRDVTRPQNAPFVSVIVPAYNEEKVITETIESLLRSAYPAFDIVIVDDGSLDDTAARVRSVYGAHPQVRLFSVTNGGKARALNYGLSKTNAEILVTLDADTVFSRTTISALVRDFSAPQVGAVAGNAKVGNRLNLLTKWQALEYITSQNLDRRAFAALNCISVVPGAVGAWRRLAVGEAGGFTSDTLAEDADLTLAILRRGYTITYEDTAVAFTEAPDTVPAFVKQRFRWMYGTLQAAWKHRSALFHRQAGALGMLGLPNTFVFQIIFPLLSPVMDLLLLWSGIATLWQRYQHPLDYSTDALQRVLFYYALFVVLDGLAAVIAFSLERTEQWSLVVWLFLQRFLYRQLMYYVAIKSMLTAIRGTMVGWGKLDRKATVTVSECT
ncbi:MAG: glycosyltransferase [Candidatus Binatia bacterium]